MAYTLYIKKESRDIWVLHAVFLKYENADILEKHFKSKGFFTQIKKESKRL